MKNLLLIFTFLTTSIYAGFDFKTCSGSGTFEQQINHYHGDYENAITVGEIPEGIQGLEINLISNKDVDIRLYASNGDKIVHWPNGLLRNSSLETKSYKKIDVSYSGYNGVNGKRGHEFIKVKGTTATTMTMKAFGYKAGYATVNYSWSGKRGCESTQNGSGTFTQKVLRNKTNLIGTIPAGIENLDIRLKSDKDIDIQLYGKDGTAIVSWKPKGLISGSSKQNVIHHNMNIAWSGYNGTNGQKGHEYIKIPNKTSEMLTMKVFGYQAGDANVTYSWGNKGTCIAWYDGCNNCSLTDDNQTICTEIACQVYGEYKCTKWKDDNTTKYCTKEYAPVCGITNPCPPGTQCLVAPIYKTFGNMCMLDVANAEFAYKGECKQSATKQEILYVSHIKPPCKIGIGMCPSYLTKKSKTDAWENFYDEIQGFTPKPHYQYKLSVEVKDILNPPADGSSEEYKLLKVLEEKLIVEKNCIAWYDGCNNCSKIDNNQTSCTEIGCSVYDEYKCTKWKDTNTTTYCTEEYTPVCGVFPGIDIADGFDHSTYKTFTNMCKLKKNGIAAFAYKGECAKSYKKNITIKSTKTDCTGFIAPGTQCLQIQEDGSNIWETTTEIKNFTYKEHYKYKIYAKITETHKNIMDAPAKSYELLKVLKKDLVDDGSFNICNFCSTVDTTLPENATCNLLDCMDDNKTVCTQEYAPVCGITNPCPPGTQCLVAPIYKTFGNMCMLDVANAEFSYHGKCKENNNSKNIQQTELTKNINLWNKEINASNYQFSVDGFFSYGPNKWSTIVKEGKATVLSGKIKIGGPKTIIGHFNFIQSLIDDDTIKLTKITYDSTYGYPTEIKWAAIDTKILGIWGNYKINNFKLLNNSCTEEYKPVCGANLNLSIVPSPTQTFGNICKLKNAKFTFLHNDKCYVPYETNITIKPKKIDCVTSSLGPTKCMQIQEEGSNIWESVYFIDNFDYQENYQYNVHVKVTKENNTMIIGVPFKRYEAIKIIKKELVENNETVCGEKFFICPPGKICIALASMQVTYKNMNALKLENAKFLHKGSCDTSYSFSN